MPRDRRWIKREAVRGFLSGMQMLPAEASIQGRRHLHKYAVTRTVCNSPARKIDMTFAKRSVCRCRVAIFCNFCCHNYLLTTGWRRGGHTSLAYTTTAATEQQSRQSNGNTETVGKPRWPKETPYGHQVREQHETVQILDISLSRIPTGDN